MYRFTDINSRADNIRSTLNLIFNNIDIESTIEGFRVLTVDGRGVVGQEIEKIKIPGLDGEYFLNTKLDSRTITVKYLLKANTSLELREKFNKLNMILHTEEPKQILFTDEPLWSFYGVLDSATNIEETSNSIVSSFTFKCLDPYKYKNLDKDENQNTVTISKLATNSTDKIIPSKIEVVLSNDASKVVINNISTSKKIVINHNLRINDTLVVDLNADYPLKINNIDQSNKIDFIETDFDFKVKQFDRITATNCKKLSIYVRERMY